MKSSLAWLIGCFLSLCVGCSTVAPITQGKGNMPVPAARKAMVAAVMSGHYLQGDGGTPQGINFASDSFDLIVMWTGKTETNLDHVILKEAEVYPTELGGKDIKYCLSSGSSQSYWAKTFRIGWKQEHQNDAMLFAQALHSLQQASPAELAAPESDGFEAIANNYRSLPAKPELPESARRYKVQAEAAVAEKRYDDAMGLFSSALELAPWWPEGHFNEAMLWADRGAYGLAVDEMKKYLALVPEAADARAAQDKIYVWEGKTK